jgi:signal transduction histidine kinase
MPAVVSQRAASTAPRWAALVWALTVVAAVPTIVLLAIGPDRPQRDDIFAGGSGAAFLALAVVFVSVGALVARRVPANRTGAIFCVVGLAFALQLLSWQYADVGLHPAGRLPGAAVVATFNTVFGEATAGLLGLSLLLFPTGRLPARGWRVALAGLVAGMLCLMIADSLRPGRYDDPFATVSNPLAIGGPPAVFNAIDLAGWMLVIAGLVSGAISLVLRLRRASGDERRRLELVLAIGSIAAIATAAVMATWLVWPQGHLQTRMAVLGVCFAAFPLAAGFAILRRGLYGIELAVNRTLVYASLTALLAVAFAATTVLVGAAIGRGSAWTVAGATTVVALLFRPLRARTQHAVDRRFSRARYDALRRVARFLEALRAGRVAPEEIEPLLRELTGDPSLELLFTLPDGRDVDARGAAFPSPPGDDRARLPVERRAGEPVALVLYDEARSEHRMLVRIVEAGGLAIEIARLHLELRRQLIQVEDSRARIVTAANEERRRIERDLHDGAQQRLVSIGLALRHAQHQLDSDTPQRAGRTIDDAVAELAVAIEELRELALGLPPSQLDAGLAPAFRELARRSPVPVEVTVPGDRLSPDVEAAAYFIGCEGLTNAVKHARASRIALRADRRDDRLVVSIADNGVGGAAAGHGSGLRGLADRVSALGGTLNIESAPGAGTTLTAELPCAS